MKDSGELLFTDGCCFRHHQEGLNATYTIVRKTGEGFEKVQTGRKGVSTNYGTEGSHYSIRRIEGKESNYLSGLGICGSNSGSN